MGRGPLIEWVGAIMAGSILCCMRYLNVFIRRRLDRENSTGATTVPSQARRHADPAFRDKMRIETRKRPPPLKWRGYW